MSDKPHEKHKEPPRKEDIPFCPVHGYRLYVGSTNGCVRYYYCRSAGCKHSEQRFRHDR